MCSAIGHPSTGPVEGDDVGLVTERRVGGRGDGDRLVVGEAQLVLADVGADPAQRPPPGERQRRIGARRGDQAQRVADPVDEQREAARGSARSSCPGRPSSTSTRGVDLGDQPGDERRQEQAVVGATLPEQHRRLGVDAGGDGAEGVQDGGTRTSTAPDRAGRAKPRHRTSSVSIHWRTSAVLPNPRHRRDEREAVLRRQPLEARIAARRASRAAAAAPASSARRVAAGGAPSPARMVLAHPCHGTTWRAERAAGPRPTAISRRRAGAASHSSMSRLARRATAVPGARPSNPWGAPA